MEGSTYVFFFFLSARLRFVLPPLHALFPFVFFALSSLPLFLFSSLPFVFPAISSRVLLCFFPSPVPLLMSSSLFKLSLHFFPNCLPSFLTSSVHVSLHSPSFSFCSTSPCISPFGLSFPFFPSLSRSLLSVSPHSSLFSTYACPFPPSSFISFSCAFPFSSLPFHSLRLLLFITVLTFPFDLYFFSFNYFLFRLVSSASLELVLRFYHSTCVFPVISPFPALCTFNFFYQSLVPFSLLIGLNLTNMRNSEHVHESLDRGVLPDVGYRE